MFASWNACGVFAKGLTPPKCGLTAHVHALDDPRARKQARKEALFGLHPSTTSFIPDPRPIELVPVIFQVRRQYYFVPLNDYIIRDTVASESSHVEHRWDSNGDTGMRGRSPLVEQ